MNKIQEIIDLIHRDNLSIPEVLNLLNRINVLQSEDKSVILVHVIKKYNLTREQTIELLKTIDNINPEDKNLIVLYLYPRVLLDRELPERVKSYRVSAGKPTYGSLLIDKNEANLFIEAYRTQQYKRFMLHLFHSFGNKTPSENEELKIYPIDYNVDECNCPLCGKDVVGINELDKLDDKIKAFEKSGLNFNTNEFIAYTTNTTGMCLCLDCIVNLFKAGEILSKLEPNFIQS